MKTTIELARKAGVEVIYEYEDGDLEWGCSTEQLKAFEALVRADQREIDAKVCDKRHISDNNREDMEAKRCAAAIRARGETK
jgi:hypothetical protein